MSDIDESAQQTARRAALEQLLGSILIRIAQHRTVPFTPAEYFKLRQDVIGAILNAYSVFGNDYPLGRSVGITLLDALTP